MDRCPRRGRRHGDGRKGWGGVSSGEAERSSAHPAEGEANIVTAEPKGVGEQRHSI